MDVKISADRLVALRKESVDRNEQRGIDKNSGVVALRKESVDRNSTSIVSVTANVGRSPQGERG